MGKWKWNRAIVYFIANRCRNVGMYFSLGGGGVGGGGGGGGRAHHSHGTKQR